MISSTRHHQTPRLPPRSDQEAGGIAVAAVQLGRPTQQLPTELLQYAQRQSGAISTAQLKCWLTHGQAQRAIRTGTLVKLWRGAYVLPDRASSIRTRLAAADLTLGSPATACLDTAAALYGFDISGDPRTHVLAPGTSASKRERLVLHRYRVRESLATVAGRSAVDPAETALMVAARAANPQRALAVLDAALRSRAVRSADDLAHAAARAKFNGIRQVRSLVPLADGRAESPPESWLRWICHDAGLPPPIPQFSVRCPDGRWYRLDLAWPALRVGCEYDGVEFHTGSALRRDRMRLNAFSAADWVIVSATGSMVWTGRQQLTDQLARHLSTRQVQVR